MKVLLFDIDGTLLMAAGAGSRALTRALHQTYGFDNGMEAVRLDGKTDLQILREALGNFGMEEEFRRGLPDVLFERYVGYLEQELQLNRATFRVLPGVNGLLERLSVDPRFVLGLATGNVEAGAYLKLKYAGLLSFFSFGGFGSDSESRTELIAMAIERARRIVSPAEVTRSYVIGDTPRDIVHGREAGASVLAVATGFYSSAQLAEYSPDLVVEDLTKSDEVLGFLAT